MKLSKTKLLCLVFTVIFAALSLFGCGKEQQSGPPQYDGFDFYIRTAQLDKSYVFVAEKALEISDGTSTVYVNGLFDEGFAVYDVGISGGVADSQRDVVDAVAGVVDFRILLLRRFRHGTRHRPLPFHRSTLGDILE